MNLNFEPFPILTTNRLLLRKVIPSDVEEMFVMRSDPRIIPHKAPCQSKEEALAYVQKLTNDIANSDSITWAITFKDHTKLLGTICYWHIQKEHDRAEIGYALHPDYHRKGIMSEALVTVLDYGFKVMQLHSIEADVDPNNIPSVKLLERMGFIREGYFKENFKMYDGRFLDSAVYSLLTPLK